MSTRGPGQPSKYRPELCQLLVEHMNSGGDFASFAGHPQVGVSRDTLYEWVKTHKEFAEAKKIGTARAYHYWAKIGQAGTLGKIPGFNTTAWIFIMKNCHGWRDQGQVAADDEIEDMEFIE